MDERLFRLDELTPPSGVAGRARLAGPPDGPMLVEWYTDFAIEAFGRLPPGFDARRMVEQGVVRSRPWLWLDESGTPQSFAVRHPAVAGAGRIGPVYTPIDLARARLRVGRHRRRDTGHPRRRRDAVPVHRPREPDVQPIYQALGYRPVLDRMVRLGCVARRTRLSGEVEPALERVEGVRPAEEVARPGRRRPATRRARAPGRGSGAPPAGVEQVVGSKAENRSFAMTRLHM